MLLECIDYTLEESSKSSSQRNSTIPSTSVNQNSWKYLLTKAVQNQKLSYFENFFKQTKYVTFSFKLLKLLPCAWDLLGKNQVELDYFLQRLKITAGIILCEQRLNTNDCSSNNLMTFSSKLLNLELEKTTNTPNQKNKVLRVADKLQRFEFCYFATTNRIRCYFNFDFGKKIILFHCLETYLIPALKSKLIRDHPPSKLQIPTKIYEIDISPKLNENIRQFLNTLNSTVSIKVNPCEFKTKYNPNKPFLVYRTREDLNSPLEPVPSKKVRITDTEAERYTEGLKELH